MSDTNCELAVVGVDGWTSPFTLPSNDRQVQIAWDDMSFNESSIGAYDRADACWWAFGRSIYRVCDGGVGAWREMPNPKGGTS